MAAYQVSWVSPLVRLAHVSHSVKPTVSPAKNSLVYFYINSLHRSSGMERPSRGGERRTAVWPSQHEERESDGAVSPPMCDHKVVLHHCVVREWCTPSGSAVATCLHAAARRRRAARAGQGDGLSGWQVLRRTPSAPPIPAHRVARCDDHCPRHCSLQKRRSLSPSLLTTEEMTSAIQEGDEEGDVALLNG